MKYYYEILNVSNINNTNYYSARHSNCVMPSPPPSLEQIKKVFQPKREVCVLLLPLLLNYLLLLLPSSQFLPKTPFTFLISSQ